MTRRTRTRDHRRNSGGKYRSIAERSADSLEVAATTMVVPATAISSKSLLERAQEAAERPDPDEARAISAAKGSWAERAAADAAIAAQVAAFIADKFADTPHQAFTIMAQQLARAASQEMKYKEDTVNAGLLPTGDWKEDLRNGAWFPNGRRLDLTTALAILAAMKGGRQAIKVLANDSGDLLSKVKAFFIPDYIPALSPLGFRLVRTAADQVVQEYDVSARQLVAFDTTAGIASPLVDAAGASIPVSATNTGPEARLFTMDSVHASEARRVSARWAIGAEVLVGLEPMPVFNWQAGAKAATQIWAFAQDSDLWKIASNFTETAASALLGKGGQGFDGLLAWLIKGGRK